MWGSRPGRRERTERNRCLFGQSGTSQCTAHVNAARPRRDQPSKTVMHVPTHHQRAPPMLPVGGWSVFQGAGGRMVANQGDGVRVRVARHPGVSRSAPVASRVPDDRCWRTIHRDWVLRHGDACGRGRAGPPPHRGPRSRRSRILTAGSRRAPWAGS